jgi:hypothetical protein
VWAAACAHASDQVACVDHVGGRIRVVCGTSGPTPRAASPAFSSSSGAISAPRHYSNHNALSGFARRGGRVRATEIVTGMTPRGENIGGN